MDWLLTPKNELPDHSHASKMLSISVRFLALFAACEALAPGAGVFVLGPGAREVQLIAAKTAANAGYRSACLCGKESPKQRLNKVTGTRNIQRALMYGRAYAEEGADAEGRVRLVSTPDEIGDELAICEGLIVCTEDAPMPRARLAGALNNAPKCAHVALLSRMGAEGALRAGEDDARAECDARGIAFSVVRAGVLRGGGPGADVDGDGNAPGALESVALDRFYYDTLAKLEEYFATTSFDKILQGAAVCDGDAYAYPNAMQRAMRVDTFEPSDTDTPRTAVAGALVAAAGRTAGIELTVSSGKAKTPPSLDEWAAVLDELSALA